MMKTWNYHLKYQMKIPLRLYSLIWFSKNIPFFLRPINALMNACKWRANLYDENLELPFEVSNESTLAALFSELVL